MTGPGRDSTEGFSPYAAGEGAGTGVVSSVSAGTDGSERKKRWAYPPWTGPERPASEPTAAGHSSVPGSVSGTRTVRTPSSSSLARSPAATGFGGSTDLESDPDVGSRSGTGSGTGGGAAGGRPGLDNVGLRVLVNAHLDVVLVDTGEVESDDGGPGPLTDVDGTRRERRWSSLAVYYV
jgi:hypothetical protein